MIPADLLRRVSRSFYLSLRILPEEIRPQISLAYLLARASDTVADTQAVPRQRRLEVLRAMQAGDFGSVADLAPGQASPAERILLERLDACSASLSTLGGDDRALIESLLCTIVSGQVFDLERFDGAAAAAPTALSDEAELDRYTYLVAGCVGEFWTRMCAAHLPSFAALDQEQMRQWGLRFGKGLQLVNILRDVAGDLRIGRCYLPVAHPRRLLDAAAFDEIRPLYCRWLDLALEHLDAGWRYTLRLPTPLWRLRLSCIWPIWIGLGTLALLRRSNPLDPARRVRLPRWRVYAFLAQSCLCARNDALLDRRYQLLRRAAAS